jgi:hypothetical protein
MIPIAADGVMADHSARLPLPAPGFGASMSNSDGQLLFAAMFP